MKYARGSRAVPCDFIESVTVSEYLPGYQKTVYLSSFLLLPLGA
jgi:hypothetical protein